MAWIYWVQLRPLIWVRLERAEHGGSRPAERFFWLLFFAYKEK
ncbi:hypothetical protein X548_04940 [Stenotrophomonas maltophilia 5BA-I-2]|jgi:hypothetical protein|nr:hypothetical protein X548_04940 [Stenotrophomonas maltophilia 5BA-I-2]